MRKIRQYSTLLLMAIITSCHTNPEKIYSDKSASSEDRVNALVSAMTLDEKVSLVAGVDYWNTNAIPRLKIPSLKSMNGPYGVRPYYKTPEYPAGVPDSIKATAFPVNVAMAATWNTKLTEQAGAALAKETIGKHHHILLAPCVNIQRVSFGGRNFESFSEDPFLTSRMGVAFVKGVQSEKVIPTVKHYACNNTEINRFNVNMKVDERTLHEIYLPAFKASVIEADAMGFMSAFVKINGDFGSDSNYLLNDLLKDDWGFRGFVMSDWGAVHNTAKTANAGLDIEMPAPVFFGDSLKEAVKTGEVEEGVLNDKARRILRPMIEYGFYDNPSPEVKIDSLAHKNMARQIATESMVLLKNDRHILPLNKQKLKKIAVIGPNANVARLGGNGSSVVIPYQAVTTLEGIQSEVGDQVKVQFAPGVVRDEDIFPIEARYFKTEEGQPGFKAEYFNNPEFEGEPAITKIDKQINFDWATEIPEKGINSLNFSIRWIGIFTPDFSGDYEICLGADDNSRLFINGELAIEQSGKHLFEVKWKRISLKNGVPLKIKVEYSNINYKAGVALGIRKYISNPLEEAVKIAKTSDVVVVCVGLSSFEESEGRDIESLHLPANQLSLIREISQVNPNTIVVLNSGTALFINDWVDKIPSLLQAWYPGQEGGTAVADILFGNETPSGKLPQSWTKKWEDSSAFKWYPNLDAEEVSGTNIDDNTNAEGGKETSLVYGEGIYVGYRFYDKNKTDVLFPFGYGLSYTKFDYSDLSMAEKMQDDSIELSFELKNTGEYIGAEIVQVYVAPIDPQIDRPVKELKSFAKITLAPGKSERVKFILHKSDFAYYDPSIHSWKADPGNYAVEIGSSSINVKLKKIIEIGTAL